MSRYDSSHHSNGLRMKAYDSGGRTAAEVVPTDGVVILKFPNTHLKL